MNQKIIIDKLKDIEKLMILKKTRIKNKNNYILNNKKYFLKFLNLKYQFNKGSFTISFFIFKNIISISFFDLIK